MRLCFFRLALIPAWLLLACAESPVSEENETTDPTTVDDAGALAPGDATGSVDLLDAGAVTPPSAVEAATASDAGLGRIDDAEGADARVVMVVSDAAAGTLDARVPDASVTKPDATRDAGTVAVDASVPPPMCTMPARACGSRCIDTRSDLMNCGECGRRCGSGESCIASRCWSPPPEGCASRIHEGRAYLFCNQERAWRAARESCLRARMDLLIVNDAAENAFARGAGAVSWIGANDLANEGSFSWPMAGSDDRPNGGALMGGYSNWLPDEPNNTRRCDGVELPGGNCLGRESDEDCVELNTEGRWNDFDCERGRRYICEAY